MPRKAKASLDFVGFTIPQKIAFGPEVTAALTLNVGTFATPDVPVADMVSATADLALKYAAAGGGSHLAVQALKNSEKAWDKKYTTNANYVTRIADGETEIVLLSGYHSTKTETTSPPLPGVVINVTSNPAGVGSVDVTNDKQADTDYYIYIVAAVTAALALTEVNGQLIMAGNNESVTMRIQTKRKANFDALPLNALMNVWVIGVNRTGLGAIMPPVVFRVPG